MHRAKADKIIEKADKTLEELMQIYDNGIAYDKYNDLLEEYKTLHKRSERILKMSDTIAKDIYVNTETLSENLDFTIKRAKEKLSFNVEEHKKSKETITYYKKRVIEYQDILKEYVREINKLQKKVKTYEKIYGELNSHQFKEEIENKSDKITNLNPDEYKNITLDELIEEELKNFDEVISINIKLSDFEEIIENLKNSISLNNFQKSIYKFIKSCFGDNNIIFHESINNFYVLIDKKKEMTIKEANKKLNSKRTLFGEQLVFNISYQKFGKID